jgi:asparagine synthase (glutamine-hydrolysing)
MKTFLVDHNLNYTDKLSMACGVEVRVPFLDQELVEFSTKLPPSMKLNNKTTKYILKKLMEKYLPNDIIYRKKIGFGAPVEDLIKNKFAKKINEYLSIKKIEERNIFNQLAIFNLIKRNKALKVNASYSILALLAIESWIRQFYDEN